MRVFAVILVVLVILAAGLAGSVFMYYRAEQARQAAERDRAAIVSNYEKAQAAVAERLKQEKEGMGPLLGRIISPGGTVGGVDWTEEEIARGFAARPIETDLAGEAYLARLSLEGALHTHGLDVTIVLLSGTAKLEMGGKGHDIVPGNIVVIPEGVEHRLDLSMNEKGADLFLILSEVSGIDEVWFSEGHVKSK